MSPASTASSAPLFRTIDIEQPIAYPPFCFPYLTPFPQNRLIPLPLQRLPQAPTAFTLVCAIVYNKSSAIRRILLTHNAARIPARCGLRQILSQPRAYLAELGALPWKTKSNR